MKATQASREVHPDFSMFDVGAKCILQILL